MRTAFIFICLLTFGLASASDTSWKKYPYQDPNSDIRFPQDEGRHTMVPNLEWWYTVIHATSETSGERYSILVTHFNNLFRFFTVTNLDRKYHISGTTMGSLSSQVGQLDIKHRTKYGTDIYRSRKDGAGNLVPFEYEIQTHHDRMNLDVSMKALKKPMMVAGDGYMPVGSSGNSWYYSVTRMEVTGTIEVDGHTEKIRGEGWMDHQWAPFIISPVAFGKAFESYEWFCLQLDDGSEIMISNIYDRSFNLPGTDAYGGVERMTADGVSKHTVKRTFTRTSYWQDPVSSHYMSMGWRLEVPEWDLDLTLTPSFHDQMVRFPMKGDFWEGSISVEGTVKGKRVTGKAFGELIHRFQVPKIEMKQIVKAGDSLDINWNLLNPDAGNPLTYQVELIGQSGTQVLGKSIRETKLRVPRSIMTGNGKGQLKVIGSSVDGTIKGEAIIPVKFDSVPR